MKESEQWTGQVTRVKVKAWFSGVYIQPGLNQKGYREYKSCINPKLKKQFSRFYLRSSWRQKPCGDSAVDLQLGITIGAIENFLLLI